MYKLVWTYIYGEGYSESHEISVSNLEEALGAYKASLSYHKMIEKMEAENRRAGNGCYGFENRCDCVDFQKHNQESKEWETWYREDGKDFDDILEEFKNANN